MSDNAIASRIRLLNTESAFQILARANELEAQGRHIIHCEIGQPDFKTPPHIIEAAYKAMKDGYTGYTPTSGYADVRAAIAGHVRSYKNVPAREDEIVIVPGGKPVMFFATQLLVDPGDEVIYPNPGFPIYESVIRYAGGIPVPMPLLAENDFRPDWNAFERSISEKTKLLILNSPSNPTGAVFTEEDMETLAGILARHPKIFVLSDEIYDRLVFAGNPRSIASFPDMKDRTVILDGFSKAYAMTGWRIGYGVMRRDLAEKMSLLMVNSNSCTAAFTQIAAKAALTGPQDFVEEMKEAFRTRLAYVVSVLNRIGGISCRMPGGAFYAFPDISSFGLSSYEFSSRLLTEGGVAAAWGTSFGKYGEGHIRLSCATSMENLRTGMERIAAFADTLRS